MREDRRHARRFSVLDEHQSAELRVGDASLRVRLVDQSATGFLILLEKHPGVYPGEVVWLQTTSGWSEVRVVKVRQEVDGTRIGLERLTDLAMDRPSEIGVLKSDGLAQAGSKASPWPIVIMVALLCGVLGFLAWTAFVRCRDGKYVIVVGETVLGEAPDYRPAAVRALESAARRKQTALRKTVEEFGAAMLTLPEVVRHLNLTSEQQQELTSIIEAALKSEEQLRQANPGGLAGDSATKLAKLYDQATAKARSVLNEQQRREWDAMLKAALKGLKPAASDPASQP